MIGTVNPNSAHGQSSSPAGKWFCPSHILVLMEGSRATWTMQRCPSLGRPTPASRIHPSSPEYLLAAAVLGYVALARPDVVNESDRLRNAVGLSPSNRGMCILPIDRDLAAHVLATCAEYVFGAVTSLPGSSITEDELRIAAASGMQVAVAGHSFAGSTVSQ